MRLPLPEYVRHAFEFTRCQENDPTATVWKSPLFAFARFCKAHPLIGDVPENEAMTTIEWIMREWDDFPVDHDPWEHFFPKAGDGQAARVDFMVSWTRVRHVPFRDTLAAALEMAMERPLVPPRNRGALYPVFISLAGWLQKLTAGDTIFLPTRTIGPLLGCDPRTISGLRRLAVQDGLLRIVKKHSFRNSGKRRATEFRFPVERFEVLKDEQ